MDQVSKSEDSGIYEGADMNQTGKDSKHKKKLSQLFKDLSALVPGLKTMEEASVLEGSIKYMKELQERVKVLEEQQTTKTTMVESTSHSTSEPLVDIKVNICGNHVLIGIHCEKLLGVMVKAVAQIEKLNLRVINSSVTTLGSSTLNITVVAQVEEEFDMANEDIVRELHAFFVNLYNGED